MSAESFNAMTLLSLFFRVVILAGALISTVRADPADVQLSSWMTLNSRRYARVWQTAAKKNANTTSTTWPRAGTQFMGGGQAKVAYTNIQRVTYSSNYVYVYTTGLPSWTMGPWSNGFPNWPSDRNGLHRFPRTPSIPAVKSGTQGQGVDVNAVLLNGVALFNCLDGQSYSATTRQVTFNGDRYWQRTAPSGEGDTMDMNNAHQQNTARRRDLFNVRGCGRCGGRRAPRNL